MSSDKVEEVLARVGELYEARSEGEGQVEVDRAVVDFFLEETKGDVHRAAELLVQQLKPETTNTMSTSTSTRTTSGGGGEGNDGRTGTSRRDNLTELTRRRVGGGQRRREREARPAEARAAGNDGARQLGVGRAVAAVVFLCFRTIGKVVTLSAHGVRGSLVFVTSTTRLVLNLVLPRSLAQWLNRLLTVSFAQATRGHVLVDPTQAASHFLHQFEEEFCRQDQGQAAVDAGRESESSRAGDPSCSASAAGQGSGRVCPDFEVCGHYEALSRARARSRFLVCYLHSREHAECARFCSTVLNTPEVAGFFKDNFVLWGGDVTQSRDAFRLAQSLRVSRYPALAVLTSNSILQSFGAGNRVVAQAPSSGMALILLSEGALSTEGLLELLEGVLEDNGPMLVAARAEQEEREASRRIREEQERDFALALQEDQRKEKEKQEELERKLREREEEELSRKKVEEKTQAVLSRRRERAEAIPEEPEPGEDGVSKVLIRFPDGSRVTRRFYDKERVKVIYNFVDSLESNTCYDYKLVSNFPRKVFDESTFEQTLAEAGLSRQAMLFLQSED